MNMALNQNTTPMRDITVEYGDNANEIIDFLSERASELDKERAQYSANIISLNQGIERLKKELEYASWDSYSLEGANKELQTRNQWLYSTFYDILQDLGRLSKRDNKTEYLAEIINKYEHLFKLYPHGLEEPDKHEDY